MTSAGLKGNRTPKELRLAPSFIASTFIHIVALLLASTLMTHQPKYFGQDFVPVRLLEVPPEERAIPQRKRETPIEARRPHPLLDKQFAKERTIAQGKAATADRPVHPPTAPATKDEPNKSMNTKAAPSTPERIPAVTQLEGGGEAGPGNLLGQQGVGAVPGDDSGGAGRAVTAGLDRGPGGPGLSGHTGMPRTNRQAKPIQTVRAVYPPMALRMGLEGDVTLKIEVDPEGRVTKAEIIKSGGAGFDEEALNAVRQSRFEPAQRDGQNVPGEFTYIYRFRLQR